jgi:hypothetical protein
MLRETEDTEDTEFRNKELTELTESKTKVMASHGDGSDWRGGPAASVISVPSVTSVLNRHRVVWR